MIDIYRIRRGDATPIFRCGAGPLLVFYGGI